MANVAKLYNVREHVKELLAEPLDCSYEKHYTCVLDTQNLVKLVVVVQVWKRLRK